MLLTDLPTEIRLQIWAYVLGGQQHLHFVKSNNRVAHIRCTGIQILPNRFCCPTSIAHSRTLAKYYGFELPASDYPLDVRQQILQESLSSAHFALLRTCQQIYAEAITIPYRSNTFDFDNLETMTSLAATLRPQHLATIRRMSVHTEWQEFLVFTRHDMDECDFDQISDFFVGWSSFWDVVATKMPSLEHLSLRVAAASHLHGTFMSQHVSWTYPMLRKRGLQKLDLHFEHVQECDRFGYDRLFRYVEKLMCRPPIRFSDSLDRDDSLKADIEYLRLRSTGKDLSSDLPP